jgi:hypothetical protein
MFDSGILGGLSILGLPFLVIIYLVPFWIIWKFYTMLSRINNNLAAIAQTLRERHER